MRTAEQHEALGCASFLSAVWRRPDASPAVPRGRPDERLTHRGVRLTGTVEAPSALVQLSHHQPPLGRPGASLALGRVPRVDNPSASGEMEMSDSVTPSDSPGTTDFERRLVEEGVSEEDARLLAPGVWDCGVLPPRERFSSQEEWGDRFEEGWPREIAELFRQGSEARDARFCRLVAALARCRDSALSVPGKSGDLRWLDPWYPPPEAVIAFVGFCAKHGIDFSAGLAGLDRDAVSDVDGLALLLYRRGLLNLTRLAPLDARAAIGRRESSDFLPSDHPTTADCRKFHYWLRLLGADILPAFLAEIQDRSLRDGAVGDCVAGMSEWQHLAGEKAPTARQWLPFFRELGRRREARSDPHPGVLTGWFRLAAVMCRLDPHVLAQETRRELRDVATRLLGQSLRPLASAADEAAACEELRTRRRLYESALDALAKVADLWSALKQVVLCFRALPARSVSSDLRSWPEPGREDVPEPWSWLPEQAARILHVNFGVEQRRDPALSGLREQFAVYCLSRLQTREKSTTSEESIGNEGLREPSPVWREHYIRALRELRVNPRGRGHRTLDFVRRRDPSPSVREVAERAYEELRHDRALEAGRSPRSAVFAAWWFLRQGHVLHLGGTIDASGAQRTRRRELRRTKQSERRFQMNSNSTGSANAGVAIPPARDPHPPE